MPPYELGTSFQPGVDSGASGPNGERQHGPRATPIQSAIKLLSLRLPSVVGAQAISPQALLQSPGSAGLGGPGGMSGGALIEWLRKQLAGAAPPDLPGSRSPGSMPSFGGPGAPSERQGGGGPAPQPVPNIPPPVIRPGEEERPPAGGSGGESGGGGSAGVSSPFDVSDQNPWLRPGRNPKLAEKYGFDIEGR